MDEPLTWCVVANIREENSYGPDAVMLEGTKHFSGGTKVWVLPPQWGDGGEQVVVVGRHRGRGNEQVRLVLDWRFLTNFRVKPLYQQRIYDLLTKPVEVERVQLWASRELAERWAEAWQAKGPP